MNNVIGAKISINFKIINDMTESELLRFKKGEKLSSLIKSLSYDLNLLKNSNRYYDIIFLQTNEYRSNAHNFDLKVINYEDVINKEIIKSLYIEFLEKLLKQYKTEFEKL